MNRAFRNCCGALALLLSATGAAAAQDDKDKKAVSVRSEEHTSELQSLAYLVCRLLLEKKKKYEQNLDSLWGHNVFYASPKEYRSDGVIALLDSQYNGGGNGGCATVCSSEVADVATKPS